MAIKADLVACLFSHTPASRPYQWSYITAEEWDGPAVEVRIKAAVQRDDEAEQMPALTAGQFTCTGILLMDFALERQVVKDVVEMAFDIFC